MTGKQLCCTCFKLPPVDTKRWFCRDNKESLVLKLNVLLDQLQRFSIVYKYVYA